MAKASPESRPVVSPPAASSYADFVEFGRDTIEAAMNSNGALGAGLEAISQEVAQYARKAFESAGETARGLLGARTFEDVVRLQCDFAARSFEGFVEGSTKLSELGYSLLGASMGGWSARAKS